VPVRRRLFTLAQWILAGAIVWYAVSALHGQWVSAAERLRNIQPSWALIGLATAITLATYVLLIDTWRRVVVASGERLSFGNAARIWFVSNLGKYVPGKVWSIAAMTMMARDSGVSPLAAAGSSVLMQLVTVAAGIGVVLVTGARAIDQPLLAAVAGVGVISLLAFAPYLLPAAASLVRSVTGRQFALPRIPPALIWFAAVRAVVSWVAYGIAFQVFVSAVLGTATGAMSSYVAVYAASYIIGFLALFAPGGAVVREGAMIAGMLRLGLSSQADALVVAIASRLWLTATELAPGLIYLALSRRAAPIR